MNKCFYKILIVILFSGSTFNVFAQSPKDNLSKDSLPDTALNVKEEKKSSFKFGADYISNNVFMGRTGINNTPIISPEIKYVFKSGLYFRAIWIFYLIIKATNLMQAICQRGISLILMIILMVMYHTLRCFTIRTAL